MIEDTPLPRGQAVRGTTLQEAATNIIRGGQLIMRFRGMTSILTQHHPEIMSIPRRDRIRLPNQPDIDKLAQNAMSFDRELWYEDRRLALATWSYQQHPSARVFLGGNIELYQGLRLLLSLTMQTTEAEERPWTLTVQPRVHTALVLLHEALKTMEIPQQKELAVKEALIRRLLPYEAGRSYRLSHAEASIMDQAIAQVFLTCPPKHQPTIFG